MGLKSFFMSNCLLSAVIPERGYSTSFSLRFSIYNPGVITFLKKAMEELDESICAMGII